MKQVLIHSSVTALSVSFPLYKLIGDKQYFNSVMLTGLAVTGLLIQLEQYKEKTLIKPKYLKVVDMALGLINVCSNPVNIPVSILLYVANCMTHFVLQNKSYYYIANEFVHHLFNSVIYFIN